MADAEKLAKSSIDELPPVATVHDALSTLLPAAEQEITVSYYPSKWLVAGIRAKPAQRRQISRKWPAQGPLTRRLTSFSLPLAADGEFNIWMVAMIAIGSLFLVFVGVTIFLIW